MNLIAHPSVLSGRLVAPASKSHMQRLVAAALLAGASVLWTEDMQDGLVGEGMLTLRNPFAA